jgi:small GTP-binding protein
MTDPEVKIVFLGESSVGKTSIISSFSQTGFIPDMSSTVGASFSMQRVALDSCDVKLKIWDTAGQERFRSLTPMYYRDAQVAILVFSVDSTATFDSLDSWVDDLKQHAAKQPAIIIVGNKIDLERTVEPMQGEAFADTVGASYIECSAKTRAGVDALFQLAAGIAVDTKIMQKQQRQEPPPATLTMDQVRKKRDKSCC